MLLFVHLLASVSVGCPGSDDGSDDGTEVDDEDDDEASAPVATSDAKPSSAASSAAAAGSAAVPSGGSAIAADDDADDGYGIPPAITHSFAAEARESQRLLRQYYHVRMHCAERVIRELRSGCFIVVIMFECVSCVCHMCVICVWGLAGHQLLVAEW